MGSAIKQILGWATPLAPRFDAATMAARLGHMETNACRSRRQGSCPGRDQCADCQWAEGPLRDAR